MNNNKKRIVPYPSYKTDNPLLSDNKLLDIFLGKPFLEFNNIIGLPIKNGKEHPIYDYEFDVVNKIENNRNVWIKNGTATADGWQQGRNSPMISLSTGHSKTCII